jgi:hypothetical protein
METETTLTAEFAEKVNQGAIPSTVRRLRGSLSVPGCLAFLSVRNIGRSEVKNLLFRDKYKCAVFDQTSRPSFAVASKKRSAFLADYDCQLRSFVAALQFHSPEEYQQLYLAKNPGGLRGWGGLS